jgi:hypothetical protein
MFENVTRVKHVALFAAVVFLTSAASAQNASDQTNVFGTPKVGGQEKIGLQSVEYRLGIYSKNDAGNGFSAGNPFLDEDLTVIEPAVIWNYGLSKRSAVSVNVAYDWVSSASISRLNDRTQYPNSQQSGASGDFYIGVDTAYRYHVSDTMQVGTHLDFSKEYDYLSIGLGGNAAWKSENGNMHQSVAVNGYFDSLDIIRFNGVQESGDTRTSLSLTYLWDGVLTASSQAQLGSTISAQSGFLGAPYNSVFIESGGTPTEVPEVLPDSRLRYSVFGSYRYWIGKGMAAELASRFYSDDWGLTGISLEPRWYQMLSENLLARLRYRYYDQNASDFSGRFTTAQEFMTQDSDLDVLSSHTLGLRFVGYQHGQQGWDAGVDYIMRSDHLDHIVASFGYLWTF